MSDNEQRDYRLDVAGAIMLGVTTALTAFAAYESSLWGGNQATAYTQAITTLGDANREMLRGVQERAFDTTVWLEGVKADAARNAAEASTIAAAPVAKAQAAAAGDAAPPASADAAAEPAAAAPGDDAEPGEPAAAAPTAPAAPVAAAPAAAEAAEGSEEPATEAPQTPEDLAKELAEELAVGESAPLEKQIAKLQASRRHLVAALKWADEQHTKRTAGAPPSQRLAIARTLVDLDAKAEVLNEERYTALAALGVDIEDDAAVASALATNSATTQQLAALDKKEADLQAQTEKELDKLAKPMFFESKAYEHANSDKYQQLVIKGNKLFEDGQRFNTFGDNYTLATVFFTLALFFGGLSSVLRQYSIKLAFLSIGTVVTIGATIYMTMTPMA